MLRPSRAIFPLNWYGYRSCSPSLSSSPSVSSFIRMSSSRPKMNSDNLPFLQQTAKSQSSTNLYSNERNQYQKRISVSPLPILKHLGLGNSVSGNRDKTLSVDNTMHVTSSKEKLCRLEPPVSLNRDHNADPPLHSVTQGSGLKTKNLTKDKLRKEEISYVNQHQLSPHDKSQHRTSSSENVNNLNPLGVGSAMDPNHAAEPPSPLFGFVSGNKIEESTNGRSQTDETSDGTIKNISEGRQQCSPVVVSNVNASSKDKVCTTENTVDSVDESLLRSSFGMRKSSQAKRSKLELEHADVNSPAGRAKQDLTPCRTECNKISEEAIITISELQQKHSLTMESNGSPENHLYYMARFIDEQKDYSLLTSSAKQKAFRGTRLKPGSPHLKDLVAGSKPNSNRHQKSPSLVPFDICQSDDQFPTLMEDPFAKDEERDSQRYQLGDGDHPRVLRPGMVLFKGYLTHNEQVTIVRECRHLGLGPGGFYQPGYKDGAKLCLMMMCLGLDWDPQKRKYSKRRRIDSSHPPDIPDVLHVMVRRAMIDSQALTQREYEASNVEEILPMMFPNICIVNFYNTTGRLGLHQDRDESRESLAKGLPVVSISVGDSAEFLYGDERDKSKAEKVVVESGDVLIFGGESRHIFHGVESIIPGSAPESLLKVTGLRPGRLNLTFRQF